MKGIDENDTKRGEIICNNLNYCQETFEFKATINVLEIPENKKLMSSGYECVLHMHAIAEQVEIFKVEAKYDPVSKKNINATFLKSGEQGTVTIKVLIQIKFSVKTFFVLRSTNSCRVWVVSP
jgi:translation elongation factor EF-1alpha